MYKQYYLIWLYSVLRAFISKGFDKDKKLLSLYREVRQEYETITGKNACDSRIYNFLKIFI